MANHPPAVAPQGLRVAIAGLRRMGMRHVQAARELGMDVYGVADRSLQAVESACGSHAIDPALGFTDAQQMLQATRPQALVVVTTARGSNRCNCPIRAARNSKTARAD